MQRICTNFHLGNQWNNWLAELKLLYKTEEAAEETWDLLAFHYSCDM